jgi:flagellar FliL protein
MMKAVLGIFRKLLIPIGIVLVVIILGVGLLLSGLLPFSIQLSTGGDTAAGAEAATAVVAPTPLPYFQAPPELSDLTGGIFYNTGQRIVNLADPGGYRFLRITIVLEFLPSSPNYYTLRADRQLEVDETFRAEIDRQRPIIDNVITNVLTSKTFDQIFTVEGKEQLRMELQENLNRQLRNRYVQRVLITDFVIQ